MANKHIGVSIFPEGVIASRVNALRAQHDIGWAVAFERLGTELTEEYKQQQLELAARDKRIEDLTAALERTEGSSNSEAEVLAKKVSEQAMHIALLEQKLNRLVDQSGRLRNAKERNHSYRLKVDEMVVNHGKELERVQADHLQQCGVWHQETENLRNRVEEKLDEIAELKDVNVALREQKGKAVKISRGFRSRAFRAEDKARKLGSENSQLRAILADLAPDIVGVENEEKYPLLVARLAQLLKP